MPTPTRDRSPNRGCDVCEKSYKISGIRNNSGHSIPVRQGRYRECPRRERHLLRHLPEIAETEDWTPREGMEGKNPGREIGVRDFRRHPTSDGEPTVE